MNERIQQLLKQATKAVDPETRIWVFSEVDQTKFAELIVKECARVQHKRFCEHGDVSWDILMEYFGVEE